MVLVWALLSAPPALAASQPAPDAMPVVHPDPAPVKNEPAATKPKVEQPGSTQRPASATQPAPTQQAAVTSSPAAAPVPAAAPHQTTAGKPDRAKDRRAKRRDAAPSRRTGHSAVRPGGDVSVAARRLVNMLAFATPHASDRSRDDGALFAGAALLLLVAAAGSVLRLTARMSGDQFRGRPG